MFNRSRKFISLWCITSLLVAGLVSNGFAASEREDGIDTKKSKVRQSKSQPASASVQSWAHYNQFCFGCHGMSKQGKSAISIQNAINSVASMVSLKTQAAGHIADISVGK